jgi:glycosyltransferase involved in cell wall biosynthesis
LEVGEVKLCFICRKYDIDDPVNGSLITWIDELAKRIEKVYVLTLEPAETEPTRPNIELVSNSRGKNRVHTLVRFYASVLGVRARGVDGWFVWQGGPYPILLKAVGKPVFQWKAHPRVEWWQEVCSRWCSSVTFTSTPFSYPGGGRVEVIGHGVDTELFKPDGSEKYWDYIMVGRICRSKGIEEGIEYAHGKGLFVIGPVLSKEDWKYYRELRRNTSFRDVMFRPGGVNQRVLAGYLNSSRTLLNFSQTALDRCVLEAMACGLEIESTNINANWVLATRKGRTSRETVVEDHDVRTVWDRILPVIKEVVG